MAEGYYQSHRECFANTVLVHVGTESAHDELAAFHEQVVVGEVARKVVILLDEQDGDATALGDCADGVLHFRFLVGDFARHFFQLLALRDDADGVADVLDDRRLDAFSRLVENQQARVHGQCAADGQLLLLPAGAKIPDQVFELFPVLKNMLKRRGGDLSGGQQQQLAIGRALAMDPQLLILDEPTEGIQPSIIKDIGHAIRVVARRPLAQPPAASVAERAEVKDAIRKVAETGRVAILLVEQYYDFARDLADHYLLMERGEFIMRGLGANMDEDGVREALAV